MGNQAYGNAWRLYARQATSNAWLPKPIWGLVESETHALPLFLAKLRHEVYRFALGTNQRFHAIYLYEEGTRRVKCHLETPDLLVLSFSDAALKDQWCASNEECGASTATPKKGRLFALAWEATPDQHAEITIRWRRRTESS